MPLSWQSPCVGQNLNSLNIRLRHPNFNFGFGEERALAKEHAHLLAAGRTDLAGRIRWVSHVDGDGTGYDIQSFDMDGSDRLTEVKTKNGWDRTCPSRPRGASQAPRHN